MVKLEVVTLGKNGNIEYPANKKGPGVLVLHAWWGLNDFIVEFCQRLAKEGFVVVAPDLYDGKIANTIKQAEEYVEQVDRQVASEIAIKSVEFLSGNEDCTSKKISVIGFSFGASWAGWLANTKPEIIEKVVLFYGTGEAKFEKAKASFLCHFAENDPYEEPEYVKIFLDSLKKAGVSVTDYIYPGTHHWFFESDKKEHYKEAASKLAWERTIKFLKNN